MIPDFKTYINETVWGDIRRRGNGTDVKQEDTIEDIFNYLNDNYKQSPFEHEKITHADDSIRVPLFKCPFLNSYCDMGINNTGYITLSTINPNKYDLKDASSQMKSTIKTLKPALNVLYDKITIVYSVIEVSEFDGLEHWYDFKIKPKDGGKITKQFCAGFIDFIFDNLDKKIKRVIKKNKYDTKL